MATNEKKIKRRIRNAYMVSTVSIALVLFLLGAVGYLILNAREASDQLKENMTLSVLLKDELQKADLKTMEKSLKAMPAVKEVAFISKDDAAKEFKEYIGNDFVGFLEGNPLPASFEVTLNAEYSQSDSVKILDTQISQLEGVEDVLYQAAIIEQVTSNIHKFNLILIFFGGTLLLISLILINNTIRMTIFSKRSIINTMKLVGATRVFILKPFLLRAIAQGIYAALIAAALISGVIYGLIQGVPEAGFITAAEPLAYIFGGILVLGILISLLFTYGAVSKYIRLNTNQLYIY